MPADFFDDPLLRELTNRKIEHAARKYHGWPDEYYQEQQKLNREQNIDNIRFMTSELFNDFKDSAMGNSHMPLHKLLEHKLWLLKDNIFNKKQDPSLYRNNHWEPDGKIRWPDSWDK